MSLSTCSGINNFIILYNLTVIRSSSYKVVIIDNDMVYASHNKRSDDGEVVENDLHAWLKYMFMNVRAITVVITVPFSLLHISCTLHQSFSMLDAYPPLLYLSNVLDVY